MLFLKKIVLGISLILFTNLVSNAQKTYGGGENWYMLLTKAKLSDKISISNEFHIRRHGIIKEQKQLIIRPAITYKLNPSVSFTEGYSFLSNSPYGDHPSPIATKEHNFWEQVVLKQKMSENINISHRYRWEHRFQKKIVLNNDSIYELGENVFVQRVRYRLTANINLKKWEGDKSIYLHVFDEIWINLFDFETKGLNQNWLYLGLGYKLNKNLNMEIAYLDQWIKRSNLLYEYDPTLQISFIYNMNFTSN